MIDHNFFIISGMDQVTVWTKDSPPLAPETIDTDPAFSVSHVIR